LTFNADTGNNYAARYCETGTSDFTEASVDSIEFGIDSEDDEFAVVQIRNIANKEKLVIGHTIARGSTGAGAIGNRLEVVGKWANTSNQITRVTLTNPHGGDLDTGSELVVLGCDDDEADSGTNFWQELATTTTTSVGDTVDSGVFTAKKYLMVEAIGYRDTADILPAIRLGNSTIDGGNNYSQRLSANDGTDATQINQSAIYTTSYAGYLSSDVYYIVNVAGKEKLVINHGVVTGSGAGSSADRYELVAKWTNTSAQANRIHYSNQGGGSSDFGIGSKMRVWGGN
jgi:hypothetical protein